MRKSRTFTSYALLAAAVLATHMACSNGEVKYPTQPAARTVESVQTTGVQSSFDCPNPNKSTLTIACLDQSTGEVETWLWNFGDGSTSTKRNVVHTYSKPDIYIVTLTVSNQIDTDTSALIVDLSEEEEESPFGPEDG